VICAVLQAGTPVAAAAAAPAMGPDELAVIINELDPVSVAIGDYYTRLRHVPARNVIRVRLDPERSTLRSVEFTQLRDDVLRRTPARVQAYALTWVRPFRVECMSIGAAFTFGFDTAYCADGCTRTRLSPYFNAATRRPWTDLRLRPTMSIAALDVAHGRSLVERGVAADGLHPRGTAYLVATRDSARNVRASGYETAARLVGGRIPVVVERGDGLRGRQDVMFYFVGASTVADIATNHFLPGAVADHLTSSGGVLVGGGQMSALRWLEAGATGSYGTVVEPCNFPGKFPDPGTLMRHYLAGETLIEAYWKSVAMPGQGLFVGEPLARPYD
jgi:uncharacterized protein (TIGR03790 family)